MENTVRVVVICQFHTCSPHKSEFVIVTRFWRGCKSKTSVFYIHMMCASSELIMSVRSFPKQITN